MYICASLNYIYLGREVLSIESVGLKMLHFDFISIKLCKMRTSVLNLLSSRRVFLVTILTNFKLLNV